MYEEYWWQTSSFFQWIVYREQLKREAIEALFSDEPNSPDEIDDFDVEEDDISFENSQIDSNEDYEDDILCEENLVNLSESEDSEERKI